MALLLRQGIGKPCNRAGPIRAPRSLRQSIIPPVVTEGGQQLDAWKKFFENGLPFIHRLVQSTGFEAESSQNGMLFAALVGEAANQGGIRLTRQSHHRTGIPLHLKKHLVTTTHMLQG